MSEIICKTYQLYCNFCHWKRLTDGNDLGDLFEIKTSPIQVGVSQSHEVKSKNQKQKFRCPQCGHAVVPKSIIDQQKTAELKRDLEKKEQERRELEESILRAKGYPKEQ